MDMNKDIPQEVKDKIASYVYKWPKKIQSAMEKDILFGYSLADKVSAEWVSVEKGLPERLESLYLVFANKNIHIMYFGEKVDGSNGWYYNDEEPKQHMKPSHWMPLPEPPGSESPTKETIDKGDMQLVKWLDNEIKKADGNLGAFVSINHQRTWIAALTHVKVNAPLDNKDAEGENKWIKFYENEMTLMQEAINRAALVMDGQNQEIERLKKDLANAELEIQGLTYLIHEK